MLTVIAVGFIFAGTHCTTNAECEFTYKSEQAVFATTVFEFTYSTYTYICKMRTIMIFMAAIISENNYPVLDYSYVYRQQL